MSNIIKNQSYADRLVDLLLSDGHELYLDQRNKPFIVRKDSPNIARTIRSREMNGYLSKLYWETFHKSVQSNVIDASIATLEGLALATANRVDVYNRVARSGENIYYDIGDDKHVVVINKKGWKVETNAPIFFRRYKHQLAQTLPVKGGSLESITEYLNVASDDYKILLTTYLPVALIADIPRQLLLIHGPQGAGKSTALSLIRSLIDPSTIPLLSPSNKVDEIVRDADHNYCFYLDNISGIDGRMSDALCRLVTGMAFTKRELFTDDEDVIYSLKRAVALNGVAQCATKPDLLDRSLIIQLERISEDRRKLDTDIQSSFEKNKAKLMGALFDAVSGTLSKFEKVQSGEYRLPRMADYYLYALAAAEYFGYGADAFVSAYSNNINEQNQESLNSSLVGMLILEFMSTQGNEWSGSGSTLYSSLIELADDQRSTPGFPKDHMWLWRKIQDIRTTLEAMGVVALRNTSVRPRGIILRKTDKFQPVSPEFVHKSPFDDGNDGKEVNTPASNASTKLYTGRVWVSREEYIKNHPGSR